MIVLGLILFLAACFLLAWMLVIVAFCLVAKLTGWVERKLKWNKHD